MTPPADLTPPRHLRVTWHGVPDHRHGDREDSCSVTVVRPATTPGRLVQVAVLLVATMAIPFALPLMVPEDPPAGIPALSWIIGGSLALVFVPLIVVTALQRTTITAWPQGLEVRHRIPIRRRCSLKSADICFLQCRGRTVRSQNITSYYYRIEARLRDGTDKLILTDVEDHDEALFIVAALQRVLRLPLL